jgi:hypothetical protein
VTAQETKMAADLEATTGEPDPIFGLIEAASRAKAAHAEALQMLYAAEGLPFGPWGLEHEEPALTAAREKAAAAAGAQTDADDAVLRAKPRTARGAAALLIFAAELVAEVTPLSEEWGPGDNLILTALVNVARTIDGPFVSEIGLSERLGKILSHVDQAENES